MSAHRAVGGGAGAGHRDPAWASGGAEQHRVAVALGVENKPRAYSWERARGVARRWRRRALKQGRGGQRQPRASTPSVQAAAALGVKPQHSGSGGSGVEPQRAPQAVARAPTST
ncbi:hypothetical protein GGX14DRAFT_401583 [Mycena pura]|uniref:Uncharacterized protein n=1 Tax=Mycena pura TaxID=153505 RepID=A0AAD6V3K8_9AGAR|nr:hypothetical protein GGX14DRAFT_401583 [Mycena pura]